MNQTVTMPFGKWRDYDIRDVMAAEPSYLAWFFVCVEDDDETLSAIAMLPGSASAFRGSPVGHADRRCWHGYRQHCGTRR